MTSQTTLWLEIAHHAAFRVGGWAFVRRDPDGALTGWAGGERRITAERTALAAFTSAFKDIRGPARVLTTAPLVVGVPARIAAAKAGEDPPSEDLDLWALAMTALSGGDVAMAKAAAGDRTSAFATAWAELGRDRAKDKGPFVSAIPKPNLAKSGAG